MTDGGQMTNVNITMRTDQYSLYENLIFGGYQYNRAYFNVLIPTISLFLTLIALC